MILTGAAVNGAVVVAGGILGVLLQKGLPQRIGDTIMKGMALCVIYLGISGAMVGHNSLIAIVSVAVGTLLGELIDLDKRLEQLGGLVQRRIKTKDGAPGVAEGFVNCSLLICVGAMAIVGSLQSGLQNDHSTLFAKSLLDCIAAIIMGASLGIGVPLAGVLCFVYEGLLTLGAQFLSPLLTDVIIDEMTCVGSILLVGVAVNMLWPKKIRVMNCVPAVFLPILLCRFM